MKWVKIYRGNVTDQADKEKLTQKHEIKADRVSCPTTETCHWAEMSLSCPISSRASHSWSNLAEEEFDFPNPPPSLTTQPLGIIP